MIDREPRIKVALLQKAAEARLTLEGAYVFPDGRPACGQLAVRSDGGSLIMEGTSGTLSTGEKEVILTPSDPARAFFTLCDVPIGIEFHWERLQTLSFRGGIVFEADQNGLVSVCNMVGLESYLASVISSEMSAEAPVEFLKAQAITARSWLVAMLDKKKKPRSPMHKDQDEIRTWQDVNDHQGFDVCADDHCQRYQGITKIISANVMQAMEETRGLFLVDCGCICDARYYKCCGGLTETFAAAWEDVDYPYLQSTADHAEKGVPVTSEEDAALWLSSSPQAFCNTTDREILRRILPSFDLETLHFYRWRVSYDKEELASILFKKSGIDFGEIERLIPLKRGPSGRIYQMKIVGTKRTLTVGKELEIRRWLSESHLLSSAFIVAVEHDAKGDLKRFIFHGGGWGHGVGLCQIGAAVMATKGFRAEEILSHYFTGAGLQKLY